MYINFHFLLNFLGGLNMFAGFVVCMSAEVPHSYLMNDNYSLLTVNTPYCMIMRKVVLFIINLI